MATSKEMIGKKVQLAWGRYSLIATVLRLDYGYPKTAYGVMWTKEDNPDYPFENCRSYTSSAHYTQVRDLA